MSRLGPLMSKVILVCHGARLPACITSRGHSPGLPSGQATKVATISQGTRGPGITWRSMSNHGLPPEILAWRLAGVLTALSRQHTPQPGSWMARTDDRELASYQDDIHHLRQTLIESLRAIGILTFGSTPDRIEYTPPGPPQIVLSRTAMLAASTIIFITSGNQEAREEKHRRHKLYEKQQESKHLNTISESINDLVENAEGLTTEFKNGIVPALSDYKAALDDDIRELKQAGVKTISATAMVECAIREATEFGAGRAEQRGISSAEEYMRTAVIGAMSFNVSSAHVHALKWHENFSTIPLLRDIHLRADQMLVTILYLAIMAERRIAELYSSRR